jgi:type IV pilus biogenesis protein CpaD/CtpE
MKSERKKSIKNGKVWLVLIPGLVFLGLAGCYQNALTEDFGQSVANNLAQQVVNPQAGLVPTASVGLTPQAGTNEMDQYEKSFKSEEKTGPQMKAISPY